LGIGRAARARYPEAWDVSRQLEHGPDDESRSGEAERLVYYALAGAIEAGLRTADDVDL
jgi:hypothetical protein